MRILIDMQGAQSSASKNRGVGRYTLEMVKAFITKAHKNHEIFLVTNGAFPESIEEIREQFKTYLPIKNIKSWQQHGNPVSGIDGNTWRKNAAELIREFYLAQFQADIIWSTNLQEGWHDNSVTSVKRVPGNSIWCSTLHDVIPLLYPEKYLSTHIKSWYLEKIDFAKESDLILTVSEYSKKEICRLLQIDETKVVVALNAFNKTLFNNVASAQLDSSNSLEKFKLGKFVLYAGGADDHKNIVRLIVAFGLLPKPLKDDFQLVLAGKDVQCQEQHLKALALESEIDSDKVIFTGFITDDELACLYKHCALFVYPSYSEGFGLPVLEAMASGAPVLAADAASIPEILNFEEALFDPFNEAEISSKIEKVLTNERYRIKLVEKSTKRAHEFSWETSAQKILETFEGLYKNSPSNKQNKFDYNSLINEISKSTDQVTHQDIINTAQTISESFKQPESIRICYLDISCLVHFDHATGIQRVVRAIASELLKKNDNKLTFKLIHSYAGHTHFYHVQQEGGKYAPVNEFDLVDHRVDFNDGDIILILDLHPASAISKKNEILYLRNRGVLVYFIVYDLIPLIYPYYFVEELSNEFSEWVKTVIKSDGAICISEDVGNTLKTWIKQQSLTSSPSFQIKHFHLGADIDNSSPSVGLPTNAEQTIATIKNKNSFLMVGTVEPRKGHAFALDAFESLWNSGEDLLLVIVGREGWRNEETVKRLRSSPEYSKRLFWLEGISDEYLEKVYGACTCLIAASEAEGFGLPLIEAAQHKKPIIARDIPVFREVAGEHAFYFDGLDPESLATCIKDWLSLHAKGKARRSDNMPWLTWQESAGQLLSKILPEQSSKLNN
jgi:glycosyltransferase involved in cell wall biosynthesis